MLCAMFLANSMSFVVSSRVYREYELLESGYQSSTSHNLLVILNAVHIHLTRKNPVYQEQLRLLLGSLIRALEA